jgi:inositol phosphorylceramide mannosyltransferase catalytic subunit
MSLSVCMLVADPPHRIEAALAPIRHLADEVVIAADARVPATDLAHYQALCDRLYRVEFINYERHLAWLHAQCTGDWIMPLEGDEVIGAELAARLPSLLGRRDVRQVWTARRWLYGDPAHVLDEAPWSVDHVVRLVRNDGALRFPGVQHAHATFERPAEYLEEPVYHLELLTSDLATRRAKVVRYEVSVPRRMAVGGGRFNEAMYLPELRPSVRTRAIPPADAAAVARAVEPPTVRVGRLPVVVPGDELDRLWERRPVVEADYAASIEALEEPIAFAPGELRPAFARVTNHGGARWPWTLEQRPAIRMGYHWLDLDGAIVEAVSRRTPFPRTVEPGDSVVVPVEVVAPETPGEYVLELDVVHEHVRWFGCATGVRCTVGPPAGLGPMGPRLVPTRRRARRLSGRRPIPRTIHRVWLGDAPMPGEHVRYGESLVEHHPTWEHRLWTDADLPSLGLGERDVARTRSPSELSDLVRYEVLARHGGVYCDTDVECLRPLDALLTGVPAFGAIEFAGRVGTAVLGARPGHPLFARAAREVRATAGLGAHSVDATGPYFLSLLLEQDPLDVVLFEPQLFYPYLWNERERAAGPFPDSYLVHHWATGPLDGHKLPA